MLLSRILAEPRTPDAAFWGRDDLVSSRLIEHEAWVRIHAYGLGGSHGTHLRRALAGLDLVELTAETTARCRAPFPSPVRTLDALHLAAADFLRARGVETAFATYDRHMSDAAVAMGFGLVEG